MKATQNTRFSITSDYDKICSEQVFPKLLSVLMAYSYSLLEGYNVRFDKSLQELSYDFSMEAIKRHLENPTKFDPSKNNDLVKYLKHYILDSLISNAKKLGTNKNELLYNSGDATDKKTLSYFVETRDIHDQLDYNLIISRIQEELKNDPPLLAVFQLRIIQDSLRREVCADLQISESEYDNRIRRVKTVAGKIIESLKPSHNGQRKTK